MDGRRAEARGTARERLLDAAAEVFAANGYRESSVDDVAAAAGLTKGALYWNFSSKQDLFFALLDERVDRRLRALLERTEGAAAEEETAPSVSRGLAEVVDEQRQLFLLMHEYWSLAARDPSLRERYAERQRSLRAGLARAIAARHEATGVPLTTSADRLATAIAALANGLVIDRVVDRDAVPDDLLGEVLGVLYDGLVMRAGMAEGDRAGDGRPASASRGRGRSGSR
jgi:AcrR family transcriptional regulator